MSEKDDLIKSRVSYSGKDRAHKKKHSDEERNEEFDREKEGGQVKNNVDKDDGEKEMGYHNDDDYHKGKALNRKYAEYYNDGFYHNGKVVNRRFDGYYNDGFYHDGRSMNDRYNKYDGYYDGGYHHNGRAMNDKYDRYNGYYDDGFYHNGRAMNDKYNGYDGYYDNGFYHSGRAMNDKYNGYNGYYDDGFYHNGRAMNDRYDRYNGYYDNGFYRNGKRMNKKYDGYYNDAVRNKDRGDDRKGRGDYDEKATKQKYDNDDMDIADRKDVEDYNGKVMKRMDRDSYVDDDDRSEKAMNHKPGDDQHDVDDNEDLDGQEDADDQVDLDDSKDSDDRTGGDDYSEGTMDHENDEDSSIIDATYNGGEDRSTTEVNNMHRDDDGENLQGELRQEHGRKHERGQYRRKINGEEESGMAGRNEFTSGRKKDFLDAVRHRVTSGRKRFTSSNNGYAENAADSEDGQVTAELENVDEESRLVEEFNEKNGSPRREGRHHNKEKLVKYRKYNGVKHFKTVEDSDHDDSAENEMGSSLETNDEGDSHSMQGRALNYDPNLNYEETFDQMIQREREKGQL